MLPYSERAAACPGREGKSRYTHLHGPPPVIIEMLAADTRDDIRSIRRGVNALEIQYPKFFRLISAQSLGSWGNIVSK